MNVDKTLKLLARNPKASIDLAEAALYLARDEYPDLDVEAYLGELAAMAHEARRYVRGDLRSSVSGLCRYLFHEMGFRGNLENYYDPQNSYLNMVLERRTGIPISLSAIVIAVGTRAGLAVQGVGLPGHFIVKAVNNGQEVLFDPFHGGRLLEPTDCENLVHQVTGMAFQATADSLQALPSGFILQRMLNNLKAIYLSNEDFIRGIRVISRLQQLDPENVFHHRDLGVCCLRANHPGRAIRHLRLYLTKYPQAEDASSVEKMLREAVREVARWN